jgi:hypothetical protein
MAVMLTRETDKHEGKLFVLELVFLQKHIFHNKLSSPDAHKSSDGCGIHNNTDPLWYVKSSWNQLLFKYIYQVLSLTQAKTGILLRFVA